MDKERAKMVKEIKDMQDTFCGAIYNQTIKNQSTILRLESDTITEGGVADVFMRKIS